MNIPWVKKKKKKATHPALKEVVPIHKANVNSM